MRCSPLPFLLLVACLPPEDDQGWTGDTDAADDTDLTGDTDVGDCVTATPPAALAPATIDGASRFVLDQLKTYEATCVAVDDLDRDGHPDLVVADIIGPELVVDLYRGNGTRTPTRSTTRIALADGTQMSGCTVIDRDGDLDLDVLVLSEKGVSALTFDEGALVDGGQVAALPADVAAANHTPELLVLIDLDHQGPLDLVVGHHALLSDECPDPDSVDTGDVVVPPPEMVTGTLSCLVGQPDGTWTAAPDGVCPSPMLLRDTVAPYGAEVGDFDDDGDADLIVVNDFSTNRVYEGTPSGLVARDDVGLDVYNHGMGVAVDDFDGDGRHDAFVTDLGPTSLYLGQCGSWFDAGRALGLWRTTHQTVTWGAQAVDLDANAAVDLVVGVSVDAAGSSDPASMCIGPDGASTAHPPTMVLLNPGDGRFARYGVVDTLAPPTHASGVPVRIAVGDLDGDLAPDVVVATGAATSILWNDLTQQSPVLRVRPVGADGLPAIGARVTVTQGEHARHRDLWRAAGKSSVSEPVATFAFADAGDATVTVRWPDGHTTTHGPYTPTSAEIVVRPE